MIQQSMGMAKRKANADGRLSFILTKESESEDMNYDINWIKIIIKGSKEMEQEEYDDAMMMYSSLKGVLKNEFPKDSGLSKFFKSKVVSHKKISEAYEKGYGAIKENNIAAKLLEMGILTHIEKIDDYDNRE